MTKHQRLFERSAAVALFGMVLSLTAVGMTLAATSRKFALVELNRALALHRQPSVMMQLHQEENT